MASAVWRGAAWNLRSRPCEADLAAGYACDPTSKSDTPIVAKPGLMVRLTRNVDKQRGFVNGAVAVIRDAACGISWAFRFLSAFV